MKWNTRRFHRGAKPRALLSPHKVFPRLQIRAKLLIAFVGLSLLPVFLVSLYGMYVNIRAMERIALEDLTHDVNATRERASNFLSNVESDLRVLAGSAATGEYVRSAGRGPSAERDVRMRRLADELLAFARTKSIYYQIIVVSADREEVVRIESNSILDPSPRYAIAPAEDLNGAGLDYYVLLTDSLSSGEIAFSPVEMRYRGVSRLPVLSFSTPLYGPKGRAGLLIANVFAGNLFSELEAQRNLGMNEKVVLVSSDGHFMYDSDERGDWNKLLASREEDNLQKEYPPPVASMILSGSEGIFTGGTGDIIAFAPLLPMRMTGSRGVSAMGITRPLYLFESVPRSRITQDARASAMTFAGFLVLFFGGALALGLLATRQFTRPISELRRGAEIISRGSYHHRLEVDTGDEIEGLAQQFNVMAASLAQREDEILQHRTRLEEMVDHRTQELEEEKGKLQAILDNVASAFVMLDGNRRIQTASAAFSSITGLNLKEVLGKDSVTVFRAAGLCQMTEQTDGTTADKVESHLDRIVDKSGNDQYLEHTTIPIVENGEVTALLQIITNVTKRKRLEEHLIHSEKLMATGEMAAIIAHGFRNSLTSIKMILQLQQESKHQQPSTRTSLKVALESIQRMESVVQELLNFARPSPMVFRLGDLNSLVEQGLALLGSRLNQDNIAVKKSLNQKIPPMVLDGAHVREAIVNILLNAIQAIEGQSTKKRPGKLTITSKQTALAKTLRDYHSPEMMPDKGGILEDGGKEIVLRKGRECAILTIADNGPGIDRATMKRIFDPFFTTKTNGTGLGLPMVKRTINAHGGILSVKSTRGKGSTFEFVFPVHWSGS